jgi:subtilisin family serine protease
LLGFTGQGVAIAHLDTGVAGDHPALKGKLAAFRLFEEEDGALSANQEALDTGNHGTHLAGILCGNSTNEESIGVAPDAQLLIAAVINGGNSLIRILSAMEWVLKEKIRILLLPFGTTTPNPVLSSMVETLRQSGVLIISSIGNGGPGRSTAPGNYSNILSVGAIDHNSRPASFSGSLVKNGVCLRPDILAPGVDVCSADAASSGFIKLSGTSQAAAFVAGLAALLLQARPDATVDQLEYALTQSCQTCKDNEDNRALFGVIDPEAALEVILNASGDVRIEQPSIPNMARYVDPALRRSIASANSMLTCVFIAVSGVLNTTSNSAPMVVIEYLQRVMKEDVIHLRTFPDGRTASVIASPRFLRALVDSEMVIVASAPYLTVNPFW